MCSDETTEAGRQINKSEREASEAIRQKERGEAGQQVRHAGKVTREA